jgi:hypothetical protein
MSCAHVEVNHLTHVTRLDGCKDLQLWLGPEGKPGSVDFIERGDEASSIYLEGVSIVQVARVPYLHYVKSIVQIDSRWLGCSTFIFLLKSSDAIPGGWGALPSLPYNSNFFNCDSRWLGCRLVHQYRITVYH